MGTHRAVQRVTNTLITILGIVAIGIFVYMIVDLIIHA